MALFREYDLRGIVGEELTEEIAEQVGRAYATMAREQGVARISIGRDGRLSSPGLQQDRKSTRLNSSHGYISYAVFCLKKKTTQNDHSHQQHINTQQPHD